MTKEKAAQKEEQVKIDEFGCVIKSFKEIVTTEQPEAEIAEETVEE